MRVTTVFVMVSMMVMVLSPRLGTHTVEPSGVTATDAGYASVGIVVRSLRFGTSITKITEPGLASWLVTEASEPSGVNAIDPGVAGEPLNAGKGMVPTTVLLLRLMMEMLDETPLVTQANCPSGVTLTASGPEPTVTRWVIAYGHVFTKATVLRFASAMRIRAADAALQVRTVLGALTPEYAG